MKTTSIVASYGDLQISFTEDGWFNATVIADRYGKRPIDWLRLPETERYIDALCRQSDVRKSHFTLTRKGNSTKFQQGTWLHPKLGIPFARWLDVDFAVWCDSQIDDLLRGTSDWKRARHEATSTFKVMTAILQQARADAGKETASHHYSNEALLINWVLTGERASLDRQSMDYAQLDLLAKLEARNAVLIGRDVGYAIRKEMLKQYLLDLRFAKELPSLNDELRMAQAIPV